MSTVSEHTGIKAPSTYQEWLACFDMIKNGTGADNELFEAVGMGTFVGSDLTKNALQKQIVETVNAFLDKSAKRFIRNLNENIAFNELCQTELLFKRLKKDVSKSLFFKKLTFLPESFRLELEESVKEQMSNFWEATTKFLHNQSYNEHIVRLEGDVEAAKECFAAEQAKKASDLNLIAEMIDWLYGCDTQDVNGQIRMSVFTLTKDLQEKAVEAHTEEYRSRRKVNYQVNIDEYSTVVNFKREDEEQEKINSFYNEKRDTAVSTIKNWPAYIGFGVGAAAIAGSFFVGFWLLILAFAGVGYGAFTLLTNKSKRKQIEMSCDESKKATSAAMRQLFAEFKQYQKELDEYDAYHDRILDEIHKV